MSNYPLLNLFLTILFFFLWIMWFMLLFRVIADIFRDDRLGGWGKAGWCLLVIVLPFLGVLVYLIARGQGMGMRELDRAQRQEESFRAYVRDAASEAGPNGSAGGDVDELERLARLRDQGAITDDEYQQAKAKVFAA